MNKTSKQFRNASMVSDFMLDALIQLYQHAEIFGSISKDTVKQITTKPIEQATEMSINDVMEILR